MMIPKILTLIGCAIIAVLIPSIEVNNTHVFNTDWPPHARLHEVWQLLTNSALALFAFYLSWAGNKIRIASVIGFCISAGFVAAYLLKGLYGGSTTYADGSVKIIFGLNATVLAVYVMLGVAGMFAIAGFWPVKDKRESV